jgi:hypothetical protein
VVPAAQQLSVLPQPSPCPHPTLSKSPHVLGMHAVQTWFVQTSPVGQGAHDLVTPHPRLTGAQSGGPPSLTSAHVEGLQQAPS